MRDLAYAIDAYIGELARRGRTANTRRKYQELLWHFDTFTHPKDCDEVTVDDCRRFLDQWRDAAPATLAAYVSILRGFFEFLVDETVLERSPMERIKRPPRPRPEDTEVVTVSSGDVQRLLAACRTWQEFLCLAVLAYVGPRRTAAARARRRDVDLERGLIRFLEKGGKVIWKPLPDELALILREAEEQGVWLSGEEYLIPNRRRHRSRERSAKVIYDTVLKVAARARVRVHPHALRAAFAVEFDEQQPGRIDSLKELLGHTRVETTWVYLRRKDKARAMEPVRGLSWSGSVLPHFAAVPPTGFEPVLPADPGQRRHGAETRTSTVPAALRAKLDELKAHEEARR